MMMHELFGPWLIESIILISMVLTWTGFRVMVWVVNSEKPFTRAFWIVAVIIMLAKVATPAAADELYDWDGAMEEQLQDHMDGWDVIDVVHDELIPRGLKLYGDRAGFVSMLRGYLEGDGWHWMHRAQAAMMLMAIYERDDSQYKWVLADFSPQQWWSLDEIINKGGMR